MDLINKFTENLNAAMSDGGVLGPEANKAKQEISQNIKKLETKESDNNEKKSPKDYLINSDDMKKIYLLAKNKKLSANKIKSGIKEFLKNPEELKEFLQSILNSRGKKEENKEAMSTGGGVGAFEGPLKGEFKEATSSGAGVGAYDVPGFQDVKMKGNTPKGKGSSWRKTQLPGGKFVQVKEKCKKFPYCNQGDIKALNFFNESTTEKIINSMSKKYGLTENEIKQIILKEFRSNLNY